MQPLLYSGSVVLLEPQLPQLRALFLTNIGIQVLDGHLTLQGLARGFSEGNPLILRAMEFAGPTAAIFSLKIAAILLLLLLYSRGHGRRRPLIVGGLAGIAVVYLVFAIVPWTLLLAGRPG